MAEGQTVQWKVIQFTVIVSSHPTCHCFKSAEVPGGDVWPAGPEDEPGGAGDGIREGGGLQAGQSDHAEQVRDGGQLQPGLNLTSLPW